MFDNDAYEMSEDERALVIHYENAVARGRSDYFDVDEMEIIIEHYLYEGALSDAENALAYAFVLHPNNRHLQCQRAAILSYMDKLPEALQLMETYRDEDDTVHTYNYAEILYKLNRKEEALALFRRLADNTSEEEDVKGLCIDIVMLLFRNEDYENALYFLDKGLAYTPNDLDFLEAKALAFENMKAYSEAIVLYNKVLDIDPYHISTWHYLASLYFDTDQTRKALEAYNYVLAINGQDMVALGRIAYCQYYLGDFAAAKRSCDQFLQQFSDDDDMLTLAGQCCVHMGLREEGKNKFLQATVLNANNHKALFGLAICFLDDDKLPKALLYLQKAIKVEPNVPEYYVALAEIKIKMEKFDEAALALQSVLAIDAQNIFAWKKLGDLFLATGAFEQALEAYKRAIGIDETYENLLIYATVAAYGSEEYDLAQNYYDKAKVNMEKARDFVLQLFPNADKHLKL